MSRCPSHALLKASCPRTVPHPSSWVPSWVGVTVHPSTSPWACKQFPRVTSGSPGLCLFSLYRSGPQFSPVLRGQHCPASWEAPGQEMLQERTGQGSRGSSLCPGGRRGSRPLGLGQEGGRCGKQRGRGCMRKEGSWRGLKFELHCLPRPVSFLLLQVRGGQAGQRVAGWSGLELGWFQGQKGAWPPLVPGQPPVAEVENAGPERTLLMGTKVRTESGLELRSLSVHGPRLTRAEQARAERMLTEADWEGPWVPGCRDGASQASGSTQAVRGECCEKASGR